MNLNPSTLHQVSGDLAAVDFHDENLRIADLNEQIAHAESVMDDTRKRIMEVRALISEHRGPRGDEVAAKLLQGGSFSDAAQATQSIEELESERDALQAGLQEIHWKVVAWRNEIQSIRQEAEGKVRECAQPLVDELMQHARDAAARLLDCYAGLQAMRLATTAGTKPDELDAVHAAIKGSMIDHGLLRRIARVEVPGEVEQALAPMARKGPAVRAQLIDQATVF